MSDFIKGVQVGTEVKKYDYDALGNKPTLVEVDSTLSVSGKAADAKVVGTKFTTMEQSINNTNKAVQDNATAIRTTDEKVTKMDEQISGLSDLVGKSFDVAICQTASGESVTVNDSADAPLQGLTVYGKSTQDGTPTPDAPVEIVSVENPTISVDEQTLNIPRTLHGIPVTSDGNYTDSVGQQWICDEVDLERGVYVQRVYEYRMTGNEGWTASGVQNSDGVLRCDGVAAVLPPIKDSYDAYCTHFPSVAPGGVGSWLIYISATSIGLRIRWVFDTVDDLVSFLSEQYANGTPVSIKYPLAIPIENPLSETEIAAYRVLHSNYPNTTVLSDAGAGVVIKYVADTKTYIDNKLAELANA
jgi:hypothetical protein